jgi:tRNA (guanine37-N1)-methyltransferase
MKRGEFFRKKFTEEQLINKNLIIQRMNGFLYIPLCINAEIAESLKSSKSWLHDVDIVNHDFNLYPERFNNYKQLTNLPPELIKELPTSYDVIGSICLIKIPETLNQYSKIIGRALLNANTNLRTVVRDNGVKGDLRIREFDIIAGEKKTETLHKEYGIKLMLDISNVYFSPRLSKEHYRISKLVKPKEIVLDMFAGIGPFSIMISKYSKAREIYSIDINKKAIEYLIKNIDLNKVVNIFPLEGDAQILINKIPKVDRIIMNLPTEAHKFLKIAISKLKDTGIIHYHKMIKISELDEQKKWIKSKISDFGFEITDIQEINLGSFSPKINHFCFDLELKNKVQSISQQFIKNVKLIDK